MTATEPPVLTPASGVPTGKTGDAGLSNPARTTVHRAPRLYGLDSLRAIAVLLVVVYHFSPSLLPGGFIGVDVFFVLSGFLITSLLVQEWQARNVISLKEFWRRRARRILPALGLMLAVIVPIAGAIGGDILAGLHAQLLGAFTFSSNWVYIATGSTYEAALTPALLNNLWSLAVEEQFYVLWPLAVVAGFVWTKRLSQRRSRAVIVGVTSLFAVVSAGLMFLLFTPGQDPSRVYFGTDTHLFGLMLGAVLAFVMVPNPEFGWPRRIPLAARFTQQAPETVVRVVHGLIALVALSVIGYASVALEFSDALTFRGGLLAVDVATVMLIAVIVCNQRAARTLEVAPLAWVGRRSYALYLWHWPVLVIVAFLTSERAAGADSSPLTFSVALVVTVIAAALSYRFVEQPVLRHGVRGSLTRLGGWLSGMVTAVTAPRELISDDPAAVSATRSRAVAGVLAVVVAAAAVVGGSTAALTRVPSENSIEASINDGADLIRKAQEEAERGVNESGEDDVSDEELFADLEEDGDTVDDGSGAAGHNDPGSSQSDGEDNPAAEPDAQETDVPSPGTGTETTPKESEPDKESAGLVGKKPKGKQVTVIGDSVTLASADPLLTSLKGAYVDAEVSRFLSDAPKIMRKLKKKDDLRDFVVVALATNSTAREKDIESILKVAGKRKVVFVTGHADRSWIKDTNKMLKEAAKEHDNVVVADWSKAIKKHKKELARDGIHPGPKGAKRYAKVVVDALKVANA